MSKQPFILEQSQRLSESRIWEFQRLYYANQSIAAWRDGAVPHYITSNPYIADAYASIVLANLRDWFGEGAMLTERQALVDPAEPIYILELGAGPGRFAFYFLRQFANLLDRSEMKHLSFRYIMTDFTQVNIDYWRQHPALQPFVNGGRLDFARFDVTALTDMELQQSGQTLNRSAIKNPIIVIANYLFDTIPQDVFYVQDGQLYESRVTITSFQEELEPADPEILSRIQISYEQVPVGTEVYKEKDLNQMLDYYRQRMAATTLLLPVAALRCLDYFRRLSGDRLLTLVGDKGSHWEEDIIGWGEPEMVIHGGAFSMTLNFHALAQFTENNGGQVLQTAHRYPSLDIATFVFGNSGGSFPETAKVFENSITRFSPDDFFKLLATLEKVQEPLQLEQVIAWLKLSRWDPNLFINLFPSILESVPNAYPILKEELLWIIDHIRENYYDIGEEQNISFYIGTLLCAIGSYEAALVDLQDSLKNYGPDPRTFYNMGLCYDGLQQIPTALDYAKRSLEVDPSFEQAKSLIIALESKLNRQARRAAPNW